MGHKLLLHLKEIIIGLRPRTMEKIAKSFKSWKNSHLACFSGTRCRRVGELSLAPGCEPVPRWTRGDGPLSRQQNSSSKIFSKDSQDLKVNQFRFSVGGVVSTEIHLIRHFLPKKHFIKVEVREKTFSFSTRKKKNSEVWKQFQDEGRQFVSLRRLFALVSPTSFLKFEHCRLIFFFGLISLSIYLPSTH